MRPLSTPMCHWSTMRKPTHVWISYPSDQLVWLNEPNAVDVLKAHYMMIEGGHCVNGATFYVIMVKNQPIVRVAKHTIQHNVKRKRNV